MLHQLQSVNPSRSWREYSEEDIRRAKSQHGLYVNARQALTLDVLCACEGVMSKISETMVASHEMPITELARLTNMSLVELVPEVTDLAARSPINMPGENEWGTKPKIVDGKLRIVAQVEQKVVADNDPKPHDKATLFHQEFGNWSPPSQDVPRVLTVGYWVDWSSINDESNELIRQHRQVAAKRANIRL